MKCFEEIKKYGKIKYYDIDIVYNFNTIDIETVENEVLIFGYTINNKYFYVLDNFFETFNNLLISSMRYKKTILSWSRYDNTFLIKIILDSLNLNEKEVLKILKKIGKVSPIFTYNFKSFLITIENIINSNIIFSIRGCNDRKRAKRVNCIDLKNLFISGLEKTASDFNIDYYSKIAEDAHIIDKVKFFTDKKYKDKVLLSNKLDNLVLIDIANKLLESYKAIAGNYPRSIFSVGSLARSFLIYKKKDFLEDYEISYKKMFCKHKLYNKLTDYAMRAYHGGKIESYVIGFIKKAKTTDIHAAYPYAMSKLHKLTGKIIESCNKEELNKYYYAFIKCNVEIDNPNLTHPLIMTNPINSINMSPYGYLKDIVITKLEYDFLIENNIKVDIIDYIACESEKTYPYKKLIDFLFNERIKNKEYFTISYLYKIILNSLYGIQYELTELYNNNLEFDGYRAGDFFHPINASYITAFTRVYISTVNNNIIINGGSIYLNMTDSIIFDGECYLDIFSTDKVLGKLESPEEINDVYILGAGRYQYNNKNKFTIKNRGFSISKKESGFYNEFDLNNKIEIETPQFVSFFKATTKKYNPKQLGYLISEKYEINPSALGGKRQFINNDKCDFNTSFKKTYPIKIIKDFYI